MEMSITKMSPNGQVVIPSEVRKDAKIGPTTKFVVFNEGGDIMLKQLDKKTLKEDIELMEGILRGEKDIREGRYVEADTNMTAEEIDKILMKE